MSAAATRKARRQRERADKRRARVQARRADPLAGAIDIAGNLVRKGRKREALQLLQEGIHPALDERLAARAELEEAS